MFCTPTGQTGLDAYIYEAAQIANAQRELNARMLHLRQTVAEEQPQLFKNSTDFMWCTAKDAEHFCAYLQGREAEYLRKGADDVIGRALEL